MQVLRTVYSSENVIIGEQANITGNAYAVKNELNEFKEITGQDLAILGIDLRQSNLYGLGDDGRRRVLRDLIEFASNGGIITASAHFSNPNDGDPTKENYRGTLGTDDAWAELVTKGTALNESFTSELSAVADFMQVLEDHGIPVIWRPFHEANGKWFWFCMVQIFDGSIFPYKVSEESFRNLWIYTYNYLTVERGLSNLIWEFSPNIGDAAYNMTAPLYGYPGDEYVDIVGFDWYTDGTYSEINTTPTYDDLTSTGKIVSIAEFGVEDEAKADDPENQPDLFSCKDMLTYLEKIRKEGKNIAYILTWSAPWSVKTMGYGEDLMGSSLTLSLSEVKAIFNQIQSN